MIRILVLYGTTDGHTAKVAHFIARELGTRGASVDVVNAAEANPDPGEYAGVVVAASVHASGYQRAVLRWVRAHVVALRAMPAGFVSVCLGVLQKNPKVIHDLDRIVSGFETATGWQPERVKIVAGAVPYTRYGWLKRIVMKHLVRKAGGSTDTSRDHEYTDWNDVRSFAESFYQMCDPDAEPLIGYGSFDDAVRGLVSATIED